MGTQAGAAAARAKRQAKAEARAVASEVISAADSLTVGLIPSDALTTTDAEALSAQGQEVAACLIDVHAPEAVRVLVESMRKPNSASLRFTAAAKLIDLSVGRERKGGPLAGGPMIQKMREALALRERKRLAVDAVPAAAGAEAVAVTSSQHAPQQQERQSEAIPATVPDAPTTT